MRAERILKKPLKAVYRVDDSDANLLKAVFQDGKFTYVNLRENREVKSSELKIEVIDEPKQTEPKQESGALISHSKAIKNVGTKRNKGATKKKVPKKPI